MLSVLIPTYGYAVTNLAKALHSQLLATGIPFELICLDNGSGSETNRINEGINELESCRFEALKKDGGRSRIRNRLASESRYPWLLFLDADVLPVGEDFIQQYVDVMKLGHKIVFGGLRYLEEKPEASAMLRWVYGNEREAIPLEKREIDPVRTFTSANFLISKELLMEHPFNESLVDYGFEDALLAIELDRKGLKIHHLDNPVYHLGLETSALFLEKTRNAVGNLSKLHQMGYLEPMNSDLLRWGLKMDKMGLRGLVAMIFKAVRPFMEKNLISTRPSMLIYDLYRLGYLTVLHSRQARIKEP